MAWVERWTVADWKTGLLNGLTEQDEVALGRDVSDTAVESFASTPC